MAERSKPVDWKRVAAMMNAIAQYPVWRDREEIRTDVRRIYDRALARSRALGRTKKEKV